MAPATHRSEWARRQHAPRIGSAVVATKSLPAWARARARIGQIVTPTADIRGMLHRLDIRWLSLKRDVQERPGTGEAWPAFADEFRMEFASWREFFSETAERWAPDIWPLTDTEAEIERWEATLEAFRSRYRVLADREPSSTTDAETAPNPPPAPSPTEGIADSVRWISIAAIVAALAWAFSSAAPLIPRLPGRP